MTDDDYLKWVVPINRSGLAIAAGYVGLFAILILPAPVALLLGLLALRDIKKNPKKLGKGRAWFGIITGAFGTLIIVYAVIMALSKN